MKNLIFSFLFLTFSLTAYASQKVEALFFYSPNCKACLAVKREIFPSILKKYKDRIQIQGFDTFNPQSFALILSLSARFKRKNVGTPAMLVGERFLVGKNEIKDNLEDAINLALEKGTRFGLSFSQNTILQKFKEFSVFTLISAGLVDGINPCAFAVIVFFVSFLAIYGYKRKEMLCIGIFYILAVFATYLLIGLGIFKFLYSLRNFYWMTKVFYYFVSIFCFLLFILALYDYFRFKKTKTSDGFILQLPSFFKKRINVVVGKGLRKKKTGFLSLAAISLLVGALVSLLEAVCTGQVYLPTIFFILRIPKLRLKAIFYLVIYNLTFIAPLLLVFIFSFLGVSSQQFNLYLKRNLGVIKLLMALLFLVLAVSMFVLS
ncbi:MAG: hypothetical protein KAS99_04560 [Candidatus Omnitrophica bacterium]|nr:hypothetical protein [Candidatus Omnitrophota bacterium]